MRFSIITPTFNRVGRLARAIQSVIDQSFPAFEHIVVDGGSTDGTGELLATFPHLTVISEPDEGLYDAINKGIRAADGDVIVILNDDDVLLPVALEVAHQALQKDRSADTFAGQVMVAQDHDDRPVRIGSARLLRMNPRAQVAGTNLFNGRFFRRRIFERVGLFDSRYRASADTEFLGRCFLAGVTVTYVEQPVYQYTIHPDALTFHGGALEEEFIVERMDIAEDHLSMARDDTARRYWRRWMWWWTFYRAVRWGSRRTWTDFGRLVKAEPAGVPDFLLQCAWHALTRSERRGRA